MLEAFDASSFQHFNFTTKKGILVTFMRKASKFEETVFIIISAYKEATPALCNVAEVEGAGLSRDSVRLSRQVLAGENRGDFAHITADGRKVLQAYIAKTILGSRTECTVTPLSMDIH